MPITAVDNRGECRVGTELNAKGFEFTRLVAEKIKILQIPIGQYYTSPTCRTRQMAKVIFGTEGELRRELVYKAMWKDADEGRLLQSLVKVLLREIPSISSNRLLLTHVEVVSGHNLGIGTVPPLEMGDSHVLKLVDGKMDYVGIIRTEEWEALNTPPVH